MSDRTSEDIQTYYICGQCKSKIFNLRNEEAVMPCPDCGWNHKDRDKYDVPAEVKLDLTQY